MVSPEDWLKRKVSEIQQQYATKATAASTTDTIQITHTFPDNCIHRGEELTGHERESLGLSHQKTWFPCTHPDKPLGKAHVCPCMGCGNPAKCSGYSTITASVPKSNSGVVLGTYGLPKLAELQVQVIRATCGPVPVLIADDGSGHDAEFQRIASQYPDVTFHPSATRLGHYAGDLSAFHKGLSWANIRGLSYLCKLSQRFILTRHNWIHEIAAKLEDTGHVVAMQDCDDSGKRLFVRSECVLFDVVKWHPHLHEFAFQVLTNPTELRIWHLVFAYFGSQYLPWPLMPKNRYQAMPETLWHCTHSPQAYHELASRFGVSLDSNFTTNGWQNMPGWKRG
jgi:hypothetical protein